MPRSSNVAHLKPTSEIGEADCDRTDLQIEAYLNAVKPFDGFPNQEGFCRGKLLIREMSVKSTGSGYPTLALTRDQCADVLEYIRGIEPRDPKKFDTGLREVPNPAMGLFKILGHVVGELRRHS